MEVDTNGSKRKGQCHYTQEKYVKKFRVRTEKQTKSFTVQIQKLRGTSYGAGTNTT